MNAAEMLAKYRIPSELVVEANVWHATDYEVRQVPRSPRACRTSPERLSLP